MITRDAGAFLDVAARLVADFGAATAAGAFLVAPDGFRRADESASDNRYMAADEGFNVDAALRQHRDLQRAVSQVVPAVSFPGDVSTPDATFPNNVFATARVEGVRRAIIGRMRHPVRQREAARRDIRGFFEVVLGSEMVDLSTQAHPCELTGALVIDRARGVGFAGLSERCDEAGARLMHEAFGLRATFMFDLAPGEYHTNVVLAVLAGRATVYAPAGFADRRDARTVASLYGPHAIELTPVEHAAFVANSISLSTDTVWMSAAAEAALTATTRGRLAAAGFSVQSVAIDAIEAAGGSLRCCIGEIF